MKLSLKIWRQKDRNSAGEFVDYVAEHVSPDISFLEMLDELNERLISSGSEPVAFEHDCREGICGSCAMVINGRPHGPQARTTACQLHMRTFKDGDTIVVEPWRAKPFPILKDLVADRKSFDRIVLAGGFITSPTGSAPDGNAILIDKDRVDEAFDAAACIGCGACVAACPNGSAALFTAAKIAHLGKLPQGQPERYRRVSVMVEQMDKEGFGSCTNHGECQASCPKEISISNITRMYRDYLWASLKPKKEDPGDMKAQ
jgi:succinate dehydrogenase / fumarate reductase, iron-sulfur subunit